MSDKPVYAAIRRKSAVAHKPDLQGRRRSSSSLFSTGFVNPAFNTKRDSVESVSNSLPAVSGSSSVLTSEQEERKPQICYASSAPGNSSTSASQCHIFGEVNSPSTAAQRSVSGEAEAFMPTQPSCPVCFRLPQDPRLLPCLHSLCKRCLDELVTQCVVAGEEEDGDSVLYILCPVCRHKCPLTSWGVSQGFPSDFVSRIFMLQSILGCEKVECSICDESMQQPVTAQCSTCKALLCRVHACSHPLSKGSANHIVVDIRERPASFCDAGLGSASTTPTQLSPASSGYTISAKPFLPMHDGKEPKLNQSQCNTLCQPCLANNCPTLHFDVCRVQGHEGEPLRLFCRPCDRFLCFECFTSEHMSHTCVSAKSVIDQKRRKIQESVEALRSECLPQYQAAMDNFKGEQHNLEEKANLVRQSIKEAAELAMEKIMTFSNELLHQVDDIEDSRGKFLELQTEDVTRHIQSMKAAIRFTDMALEHCVGIDLLPVCTLLEQRLDGLRSAAVSLKPRESSSLVFKSPRSPPPLEDYIGVVANSLAAPQFCRVLGHGKIRAMPRKPSVVTVLTYDMQGERVNIGGDRIMAKWITRESCDSDTLISLPITSADDVPDLAVTDHKNGQYSIKYTLKETGTYMLAVSINNEPLPESPFHIDCSQWCLDADTCSEHILLLSNRREAVKVRGSMNNDFLVGNCPLLFGKHTWKVIINSAPYWVAAGVTKKPAYDPSTSWGWSSVAHQLPEGQELDIASERWQEKDTLIFELDCDQHTLKMTNKRLGRSHTISRLPETELYPWFVLYKQGDSIRIETDCDLNDM